MSKNSRVRRKCHASRRRADRLRRKAAKAAVMSAVRGSVPDAADPAEANAPCAVGCALALVAAVALLVWCVWCR